MLKFFVSNCVYQIPEDELPSVFYKGVGVLPCMWPYENNVLLLT